MRQGDVIAPSLFNIVLKTAIIRSKVGTQGTIFKKYSQIMAHADDVVLWEEDYKKLKEYLHHWSYLQIRCD